MKTLTLTQALIRFASKEMEDDAIEAFANLGKAANKTAKAFQEARGPLYRASIKDTSNRPMLIISGTIIILAIAEIIYFAVYWGWIKI